MSISTNGRNALALGLNLSPESHSGSKGRLGSEFTEVLGGGCRMPWVQQAILKSKSIVMAKQVSSFYHS
jgi:hypothetical protein